MKKNLFLLLAVIAVIALLIVMPKVSENSFFSAGGGVNLKDLNKKDSTSSSLTAILQINQTTKEPFLFQGLGVGNYYVRKQGFFFDANVVGGISTQYGICMPTCSMGAGMDFNSFQIEYKIGNFKRGMIATSGFDPQFDNFCLDMGEKGSASNAMQLGATVGKTRFGFGHHGGSAFYDLTNGGWYIYTETPVCSWLSLGGGVDFGQATTGYAAAKAGFGDNSISVTANKIGTEKQNYIVAYNRNNISVNNKVKMSIGAAAWTSDVMKGLHLVTGLSKGKFTFFTQIGSQYTLNALTPYIGCGANLVL